MLVCTNKTTIINHGVMDLENSGDFNNFKFITTNI